MKRVKSLVLIAVLALCVMPYIATIKAANLTQTIPPQNWVTFNWTNQTLKQFWVNNTYIKCWFDGTQGATLTDVRHYSNLTNDLIDDDKMVINGPDTGWHSSRWGLTPNNVTVSYVQSSAVSAKLTVSVLTNKNINFTKIYYFSDSEAIVVHWKITFNVATNITEMGHELVAAYVPAAGSKVAYVNKTGYTNIWTLTGDTNTTYVANSTAGTFPLAENWFAVYNTTKNLCVGIIYTSQSNLLTSLGHAVIGFWDGAGFGVTSLFSRWYTGPATVVPAGSVFEDTTIHWFGTGDYKQIRASAGMVEQLLSALPLSAWIAKYNDVVAEYAAYRATHNITWTTYATLQSNFAQLQADYNSYKTTHNVTWTEYSNYKTTHNVTWTDYSNYKATHNVTWTDYQKLRSDLDAVSATLPMYAVGTLIVGLVVGVAIGWLIKRKK